MSDTPIATSTMPITSTTMPAQTIFVMGTGPRAVDDRVRRRWRCRTSLPRPSAVARSAPMARVAVVGGHGKTGRAVRPLRGRAIRSPSGGPTWRSWPASMAGCDAALRDRPEPPPRRARASRGGPRRARPRPASTASSTTRSPRRTYRQCHTTWPRPRSEDLVRRSGLTWTILQPGVYLQNFRSCRHGSGARGPVRRRAPFGFLDLADLRAVAAPVLIERRALRSDLRAREPPVIGVRHRC